MTNKAVRSRMRRWAFSRRLAATIAAMPSVFAAPIACNANTPSATVQPLSCRTFIAEAAMRFDVPEERLSAIMRVESGGSMHAVSRAGAMGCMQIMPTTWTEVRTRYALGNDAFDPRDNVFAGAAYLHELIDRYGWPGALAAYNAGPNRYAEFLVGGRALPFETREYVTQIATVLARNSTQPDMTPAIIVRPRWTEASIFVATSHNMVPSAAPVFESSAGANQASEQPTTVDRINPQPSGDRLFVGQHR